MVALKEELQKSNDERAAFFEQSTELESENAKLAEELQQRKETEELLRKKLKECEYLNAEVRCQINFRSFVAYLSLSILVHKKQCTFFFNKKVFYKKVVLDCSKG